MVRGPKNITNMNECAFRIGVVGNDEKSIQEILDSAPPGYSSKEQTANSVRPIFEDLNAMRAYRNGCIISGIKERPKTQGQLEVICSSRKLYCIGCGFNKEKGCDVPVELYRKVSVNGVGSRE